jgi:hypothetical protein
MHVKVLENQALKTLEKTTSIRVWTLGHKTHQVFGVEVEAEAADVGHTVGLMQTLLLSKRIAKYHAGGQLVKLPTEGPPCLDGREDTKPWYNDACKGKVFGKAGEKHTFTMDDAPDFTISRQLRDQQMALQELEDVSVEEHLVISLLSRAHGNTTTIVKQWTWKYSYETKPKRGEPADLGTVVSEFGEEAQEQHTIDTSVLQHMAGKVAGEKVRTVLTPGWVDPLME